MKQKLLHVDLGSSLVPSEGKHIGPRVHFAVSLPEVLLFENTTWSFLTFHRFEQSYSSWNSEV
jgi:hypothetical protein